MPPWDERFERLLRFYSGIAGSRDVIGPDVPFDLLGVDTRGLLGLIADSEEVFGVEFPNDMLNSTVLATPGSFWRALRDLIPV